MEGVLETAWRSGKSTQEGYAEFKMAVYRRRGGMRGGTGDRMVGVRGGTGDRMVGVCGGTGDRMVGVRGGTGEPYCGGATGLHGGTGVSP